MEIESMEKRQAWNVCRRFLGSMCVNVCVCSSLCGLLEVFFVGLVDNIASKGSNDEPAQNICGIVDSHVESGKCNQDSQNKTRYGIPSVGKAIQVAKGTGKGGRCVPGWKAPVTLGADQPDQSRNLRIGPGPGNQVFQADIGDQRTEGHG